MKIFKRTLFIFCVIIIGLLCYSVRRTPIGIGILVPKVLAQSIQLSCPNNYGPINSLTLRNASTGNLLNWGCFDDRTGNISIGNSIYIAPTATNLDFGAQINSAYTALPSTGGYINIAPKSDGSCYNYTTTISFGTAGKYLILQGLSAVGAGTPSPSFQGVCLNYTPTTGNAIIIDWTWTGGGGYTPGAGLRDITLVNNLCSTQGGCGSSAVGVLLGNVNAGAHKGLFSNVKVSGFGTGYKLNDSGTGWGITWLNSTVVANTIGIDYGASAHENDAFIWGCICLNGTGVNILNAGQELTIQGGSIDSNTTAGFAMGATGSGSLHVIDVHWENSGPTTTHYITGGNSNTVDIQGGTAFDDATSGTTDTWFAIGLASVKGLQITSRGRTLTGAVFNIGTRATIDIINQSPSIFATPQSIANTSISTISVTASGITQYIMPPSLIFSEGSAPSGQGVFTGYDNCYGDSSHVIKCQYNNAGFLTISQFIGTSFTTTAAASDNVTVTGMTTTGHCYVTATNAGAAGGISSVFISAKAANQITVSHTATAGWTFDVVCAPQ